MNKWKGQVVAITVTSAAVAMVDGLSFARIIPSNQGLVLDGSFVIYVILFILLARLSRLRPGMRR